MPLLSLFIFFSGMVAASTAKILSSRTVHSGPSNNSTPEILLVCDRTFCNLIATAQRLVGGWSGPAIRMLVPFWNTNVAADFQAAQCPKVVANDPADAIIVDPSSLRSGLAVASELQIRNSFIIGTPWDAPVSHRMAEWENVGLYGTFIVTIFQQWCYFTIFYYLWFSFFPFSILPFKNK